MYVLHSFKGNTRPSEGESRFSYRFVIGSDIMWRFSQKSIGIDQILKVTKKFIMK